MCCNISDILDCSPIPCYCLASIALQFELCALHCQLVTVWCVRALSGQRSGLYMLLGVPVGGCCCDGFVFAQVWIPLHECMPPRVRACTLLFVGVDLMAMPHRQLRRRLPNLPWPCQHVHQCLADVVDIPGSPGWWRC